MIEFIMTRRFSGARCVKKKKGKIVECFIIVAALFIIAKFARLSRFFRSTLLKYVRTHCNFGIFVYGRIRYAAQCTISCPHLNAFPRYPPLLPFFFLFCLIWSRAAVIGNNPGEPHWNSGGVHGVYSNFTRYPVLPWRCFANGIKEVRRRSDKRNCFRRQENAPNGKFSPPWFIRLHRSY